MQERNVDEGGRQPFLQNLVGKARRFVQMRRSGVPYKKILNVALCRFSLHTGRIPPLGDPYYIMVEPTAFCNLKCPLCPTGEGTLGRPQGNMKLETFQKLVDDLEGSLLEINLTNYGEPFINKNVLKMVRYAKDRGIRVIMGSNGHFLDGHASADAIIDSGLDQVYFSMDGATQATYEKYRVGGHIDQVMENVGTLVKERKRRGSSHPEVELQFIVMRHNEHEEPRMREIARELDVDRFLLKSVSFNNSEWREPEVLRTFRELFPRNQEHQLYDEVGDGFRWKEELRNECDYLWRGAVVLWDGRIVPCCLDPKAELDMGNVHEGFRSVWRGPRYNALRRQILKDKSRIPICSNCLGCT